MKFGFENNKLPKIHLSLILNHDGPGSFRAKNNLIINKFGELTVLIDVNNQILLMGDPIGNVSHSMRFMEILQKSE